MDRRKHFQWSSVVLQWTLLLSALLATSATFAQTASTISSASVTAVRSRVYATGSSAPAFTIGNSTSVDAVHNGNFWIPDFPTGGSGTLTVDVLFSTNAAITLGSVTDFAFAMGYGASNNWPGVTAKVITSTDGTTVTVLNTLSGSMDASAPNQLRHYSGSVTGAGAALWFGVRFQTVPISYPFIFGNLQLQTAGGTVLNGSCGSANGVARTSNSKGRHRRRQQCDLQRTAAHLHRDCNGIACRRRNDHLRQSGDGRQHHDVHGHTGERLCDAEHQWMRRYRHGSRRQHLHHGSGERELRRDRRICPAERQQWRMR